MNSAAPSPARFRLRELPFAFRVATNAVVLALLLGLWASLDHVRAHHAARDDRPGVSLDDLTAAYHGWHAPSRLAVSLESGHPPTLAEGERRLLVAWLAGAHISEEYDDPDRGALAPAEILEASCLACHARKAQAGDGIGARVPLEYWDDVKKVAFARSVDPVPEEILVTSTHTHALSLATITLVVLALLFATRFAQGLRGAIALGAGIGLVLDLSGWWLARANAACVWLIVVGGAAWAVSIALGCALVLLELWLPRTAGRAR